MNQYLAKVQLSVTARTPRTRRRRLDTWVTRAHQACELPAPAWEIVAASSGTWWAGTSTAEVSLILSAPNRLTAQRQLDVWRTVYPKVHARVALVGLVAT